jgi:hypothetical protein
MDDVLNSISSRCEQIKARLDSAIDRAQRCEWIFARSDEFDRKHKTGSREAASDPHHRGEHTKRERHARSIISAG